MSDCKITKEDILEAIEQFCLIEKSKINNRTYMMSMYRDSKVLHISVENVNNRWDKWSRKWRLENFVNDCLSTGEGLEICDKEFGTVPSIRDADLLKVYREALKLSHRRYVNDEGSCIESN